MTLLSSSPPRFRLLPFLMGLALLAFCAHAASLAQAVSTMEEKEAPPPPPAAQSVPIPTEEKAPKAEPAPKEVPKDLPASSKWPDAADTEKVGAQSKAAVEEALAQRAAELDKRAEALDAKEALLKAAQSALAAKIATLNALKTDLNAAVIAHEEAKSEQVVRLVKIYEGMKPSEAARLFDIQDPRLSVAVLRGMSERKISPLIAAMNPDKARLLTSMLAEEATIVAPSQPLPSAESQP